MLLSMSESFFKTPFAAEIVRLTSSVVEFVSSFKAGISFIGVTVIVNVAVSVPP